VVGWPGSVRLTIAAVQEIVSDDVTWPTTQAKLVELRSRVLAAVEAEDSVRRTLRLGAMMAALPELPYETEWDIV